jgi:hypothetical protein
VGSFGIELVSEGVEAGLLLETVETWWPGCFGLQREVHALVAAVLLGLAGLDALDGNAEPEPPDGELGEIEQRIGTSEGDAIVGANGRRQAALDKQLLEGGECEVLAGGLQSFAQEQEARGMVGDGERVAIAAVAELELALEVGAPKVVRDSAPRSMD